MTKLTHGRNAVSKPTTVLVKYFNVFCVFPAYFPYIFLSVCSNEVREALDHALNDAKLNMSDLDGLIALPSLAEPHFMEGSSKNIKKYNYTCPRTLIFKKCIFFGFQPMR